MPPAALPALDQAKVALRREVLARRDALPPATRAAASEAILARLQSLPAFQDAGTVFCFLSAGTEVETGPVVDWLVRAGKVVVVPRIPRGEPMRAVRFPGWDALRPGPLGILAPVDDTAYAGTVDVVITPGVAFTVEGARLGYGRGYYDRWFSTHVHGLRVGIALGCQLVPTLPEDAHDLRVHQVITEGGATP